MKKNKFKLDNIEDINYNIIQNLGYSPNDIIDHYNLKNDNIKWEYSTFMYKSFGLGFLNNIKIDMFKVKEFIDNLTNSYTYAIIPIIVTIPTSK